MPGDLITFLYDPLDPVWGMFTHPLMMRVKTFALDYPGETDPEMMVRQWFSRLFAGDKAVALVATATPEGQLLGHALAVVTSNGSKQWLFGWQWRVDSKAPGVGEALIDKLKEFALPLGITTLLVSTNREPKAMQRKYGFEPYQTVMTLDLSKTDERVDC